MVWHVVRRAEAAAVGPVVVATDDERIRAEVESRGGRALMTSATCRNGTERVAEVARHHPEASLLIDVQGDEPLLEPGALQALYRAMAADPDIPMATLAFPLDDPGLLEDPHVGKVEVRDGQATTFWRRAPGGRGGSGVSAPLHHAGVYGFRRGTLLQIAGWQPTEGERSVSLEQLRALENGVPIHVVRVERGWPSVNTPEDLVRVRGMIERGAGGQR